MSKSQSTPSTIPGSRTSVSTSLAGLWVWVRLSGSMRLVSSGVLLLHFAHEVWGGPSAAITKPTRATRGHVLASVLRPRIITVPPGLKGARGAVATVTIWRMIWFPLSYVIHLTPPALLLIFFFVSFSNSTAAASATYKVYRFKSRSGCEFWHRHLSHGLFTLDIK